MICRKCERDLPRVPRVRGHFVVAHVCVNRFTDVMPTPRRPTTDKGSTVYLVTVPRDVWEDDSMWEPVLSHVTHDELSQTTTLAHCWKCEALVPWEKLEGPMFKEVCPTCARHARWQSTAVVR